MALGMGRVLVAVLSLLLVSGCASGLASTPALLPWVVAARPAPAHFVSNAELRDVFFELDGDHIGPAAAGSLEAVVEWLHANPAGLVLVEGHTDERGTTAYDLAVGERRAAAVAAFLVARDVAAERIVILSYGEERPACAAHIAACRRQNRRAHVLATPR